MAANPSLPTPYRNPNLYHRSSWFEPSFLVLKPSSQHLPYPKYKNRRIKCEIASFGNPQNWTVDHIVGNNSSLNSISMAATVSRSDSPPKQSKKVCLFYCADTKALAERVAAESDAIELRSITWRYIFF